MHYDLIQSSTVQRKTFDWTQHDSLQNISLYGVNKLSLHDFMLIFVTLYLVLYLITFSSPLLKLNYIILITSQSWLLCLLCLRQFIVNPSSKFLKLFNSKSFIHTINALKISIQINSLLSFAPPQSQCSPMQDQMSATYSDSPKYPPLLNDLRRNSPNVLP